MLGRIFGVAHRTIVRTCISARPQQNFNLSTAQFAACRKFSVTRPTRAEAIRTVAAEKEDFDKEEGEVGEIYHVAPIQLYSKSGKIATNIFQAIKDEAETAQVLSELYTLYNSILETPELEAFLTNPVIKLESTNIFLDTYAKAAKFSPYTRDILEDLAEAHQLGLLPAVADDLGRLLRAHVGLVSVDVFVARQDAAVPDHKEIREKLELPEDTKLKVHYHVNKRIRGGVVLKTDDYVYDDALSTDLIKLNAAIRLQDSQKHEQWKSEALQELGV